MFKNIFKLEAGHYLEVGKGTGLIKKQYWDAIPKQKIKCSEAQAADDEGRADDHKALVPPLDGVDESGQDTQRAFASARGDLRRVGRWGDVMTRTALMRGDLYHSSANGLTSTATYQGLPGWQARPRAGM